MSSNLSVVVGVDTVGFNKAIDDARKTLQKYKNDAQKSSDAIKQNASVSKEQIAAYERVVKALTKVGSGTQTTTQQQKSLTTQIRELKAQWANLSEEAKNSDFGKAISDSMKTAQRQLTQLNKQLESTKDNMKSVNNTNITANTSSFKNDLNQITQSVVGLDFTKFTKVGAVIGVAAAVGEELKHSTELSIQFEDALSNLSAITGMQGKALEQLKEQIKNTGRETSTSFQVIADSYTKVGSKMPELLKQPKALDAVTRSVITLSKAARMDLDSATESLTGIMNQMGASANEANRYINVLAAGSKNGAGDISYLATAFNKAGTSAATAGLSVEETTSLIEVLASKIPDASTAGTNLRNILLKMATGADEFNPKVVGMQKALENLSAKTNDLTFMTKLFGAENVSAAITLAESASKARELTEAVTGTNEAEQQAKIQTDNVAGALQQVKTDWDNFITSLNNSTGVIKTTINWLDTLIKAWNNAFFAKSRYEDSADRGAEGAQQTSDNHKQEASKNNKDAKSAYQEYKRRMEASIADAERTANKLIEEGVDADKKRQETLYNAAHQAKMRAESLRNQLAKTTEQDFAPSVETPNTSTNTSTNTKTPKSGGTKTETPLEKYNNAIQATAAQYKNKLITETQSLQQQITATQTYISELSKTEKSVEQNKDTLNKLNSNLNKLKNSLSISTAIDSANKKLEDSSDKLRYGLISTEDYMSAYRNSLLGIIDEYYKLDNITDEQRKAQIEYIKKLRDFDIQKMEYEKSLKKETSYKDVSYDLIDDIVLEQTPTDLYKQQRELTNDLRNMWFTYFAEQKQDIDIKKKLGVEFDLETFDDNFYKKHKEALDKAGIKITGPGTLESQLFVNLTTTMPFSDEFEEKRIQNEWQGDRTNYGVNTTSYNSLQKSVTSSIAEPETDLQKKQKLLNKLLEQYKDIEKVLVDVSKQKFEAGLDFHIEQDQLAPLKYLEKMINDLTDSIQSQLKFKVTMDGIDEALNGMYSIGSTISMWENMGDSLDNAKSSLDQFLIVFDGLISTFELVNGLVSTYNTLQSIFGTSSAAAAVATSGVAAAENVKSESDVAQTATATAATVATKAQESALLDLAAAQIFAAHASIPFVGVGTATGFVTTMMASMTAQHAASKSLAAFTNGGIVKGNYSVGDFQIARLNNSEMVMNGTQQQRLWNILNGSMPYQAQSAEGGNVKFVLEGANLYGSLKNYSKMKPNGIKF